MNANNSAMTVACSYLVAGSESLSKEGRNIPRTVIKTPDAGIQPFQYIGRIGFVKQLLANVKV